MARNRRWPGGLAIMVFAALLVPVQGVLASDGSSWSPQSAIYGAGSRLDQPVTMSDGVVLRADVYYPTVSTTGTAAPGPFPVLLQQTPYGKQNIASASAIANTDIGYLVKRGFQVVIADVRGTGQSQGTWGLFDPIQGSDGAALVNWSTRLPHADGKVGLFGESYMGINQFLTVGALGDRKPSPVKAMFPIVSGNDLYRDEVTQGGIPQVEFNLPFLGLVAGLNAVNPLVGPPGSLQRLLPTELQHAASLVTSALPLIGSLEGGGDQAYDEAYWAARNPINALPTVAGAQIPTFLVGGWFDLFQRGELLNFTGLQNAAAGRPVTAPLLPGQPLSPRYQLMMGPWYHVTTGQGVDLPRIELEWFDTWLLGQDTPLAHTTTPLHLYELQAKHWVDTATWPVSPGSPTKYYLGSGRAGSGALSTNDGSLSTAAPTGRDGADTIMFTGLSSVCDRQTDQWSGGILALASSSLGVANPCDANDVSLGTGPGALTYTTAPLPTPQVLAGPIDASIYATANTTDTDLVATVEEVSPTGQSVPLTSGALLGSFRAVDRANSWVAADGSLLLPYHPYTRKSQQPVTPGQLTHYDIEVFPTLAEIPAGWRIRLTLTTSDIPHLLPALTQLPHLIGGVYHVQRNADASSYVNLPLAPPSALPRPCGTLCG